MRRMPTCPDLRGRALALSLVIVAVAGCAATARIQVREVEQETPVARTTPFTRIAVVAVDRNADARRAWEDAFAKRLGAAGTTVARRDGLPGASSVDAEAVLVDGAPVIEAARAAGADAILFVRPPNAVPMRARDGARRFLDARSGPDVRTSEFDNAPSAVAEVRLFQLSPGASTGGNVWRAFVTIQFPSASGVAPGGVADAAVGALQRRGFVRPTPG